MNKPNIYIASLLQGAFSNESFHQLIGCADGSESMLPNYGSKVTWSQVVEHPQLNHVLSFWQMDIEEVTILVQKISSLIHFQEAKFHFEVESA